MPFITIPYECKESQIPLPPPFEWGRNKITGINIPLTISVAYGEDGKDFSFELALAMKQ